MTGFKKVLCLFVYFRGLQWSPKVHTGNLGLCYYSVFHLNLSWSGFREHNERILNVRLRIINVHIFNPDDGNVCTDLFPSFEAEDALWMILNHAEGHQAYPSFLIE